MSNKWIGLDKPITAAAAEAEPLADRLFSRPAPRPSSATIAALQNASAPPLLVADLEKVKARQRPRLAS
jgi:hypothetical protein